MEGIWASSTTVYVSTQTQQVIFGNGGIKFADNTTQTTASISQVKSTGSVVNFASTLGFTSAQTSFTNAASVTGSTIAFVVTGTTVACWTAGRVLPSAGDIVTIGIGVDSSVTKIPGTSATVGIGTGYAAGANIRTGIQSYIEFQVTAGAQHVFWLGLWSGGATLTFPDVGSIAQFGCREVISR